MFSLLSKTCQKLHKKRKADGYNTDIWGYSECERHQLPNRDIKKPSANNHFDRDTSLKVIESVWRMCNNLRKAVDGGRQDFEDFKTDDNGMPREKSHIEAMLEELENHEKDLVEQMMTKLENKVKGRYKKTGYGPLCTLTTFQVLAMFDIVPMRLAQYATIKKKLGGHKFCELIGKDDLGMASVSIDLAREWVESATLNLREIIGPDLSDQIVENSMCMLFRWYKLSKETMKVTDVISKRVDCFIVHEDRGLQNFIRYSWENNDIPMIEFVPGRVDCFIECSIVKKGNKRYKKKVKTNPLAAIDVIPLTSWGKSEGDLISWSQVDDDCSELYGSTLIVHDNLIPAFRTI